LGKLRRAGIEVEDGLLSVECTTLNEAFNHWIQNGTPRVTVKAAMTLDGKIATRSGQSQWITGKAARHESMKLRMAADAILVGVNTILADDPQLTIRPAPEQKTLRRIILDSQARTPLTARVVSDPFAGFTTVVTSRQAPLSRTRALSKRVRVLTAPARKGRIDLRWLLKKLGAEEVTNLLVEGGGEVNASFLLNGLAQAVAFFYAPMILGGSDSIKAVAGEGAKNLAESLDLEQVQWRRVGVDWLLQARIAPVKKYKRES
jgi:diaminohydroxyphosphoribosylaminopyrimidine deaminase/5-amino-6-(5-phosphoribosylamino)uracil reductase